MLEILQITQLMLKFEKIKIRAKRIAIQPYVKESESLGKSKGKNIMNMGINLNLNLNLNINLFNRMKDPIEVGEFENIMRLLILLFEYDKTYPESKKMLMGIRQGIKFVKNLP